jgi:hypothetical protein
MSADRAEETGHEARPGAMDGSRRILTVGSVRPLPTRDSVPGQPFRTPEVVLDTISCGSHQVAAASFVGLSHLAAGVCRQDSFGLFAVGADRLCVAVADGLGSRPASQLGAHLFVESVGLLSARTGEADTTAGDLLLEAGEHAARVATSAYAQSADAVACVGLVAMIGQSEIDLARVGDATAFTVDNGEFVEVMSHDDGYVNVVTCTLFAADVGRHIERAALPLPAVLCLTTDGLATDIRNSPAVRSWLGDLWRHPLAAFAFGDSLRFRRQGSHDDRTGVVIWQREAAGA